MIPEGNPIFVALIFVFPSEPASLPGEAWAGSRRGKSGWRKVGIRSICIYIYIYICICWATADAAGSFPSRLSPLMARSSQPTWRRTKTQIYIHNISIISIIYIYIYIYIYTYTHVHSITWNFIRLCYHIYIYIYIYYYYYYYYILYVVRPISLLRFWIWEGLTQA